MRNLILMLLLAGVSGSAVAAWELIFRSSESDIYVDRSSVKSIDGGKVTVVRLTNLKQPVSLNIIGIKKSFHSSKIQDYIDCKNRSFASVHSIFYSGRMGSGNVIYQERMPVQYQSIWVDAANPLASLLKIACT